MDDKRAEELAQRALRVLSSQTRAKPLKEEVETKKLLERSTATGAPSKVAILEERSVRRRASDSRVVEKRQKTSRKLVNRTLGEEIHELRVKGFAWKSVLSILRENNPEMRNLRQIQDIYFNYLDISRQNRRENIEEMREIQHERLEAAWTGLQPKIEIGRERAVEVGIKVLERQARLWGLDAGDAIENKQSNQQINIMIQAHPGDQRAQDLIIEHQPQLLEEHED